jgi:membrane protease YdiL (CAAX protease family)
MLVPGLLLLVVLSLLVERLQIWLRRLAQGSAAVVLVGPLLLTAVFSAAAWQAGAGSVPLSLLVLVYTLAPAACVLLAGGPPREPRNTDFLAILLLWLPLEFAAGASLVPKPAQGYLHAVAYGIAIVLALWLFLIRRGLKGMKYNLPRSGQDALNPLLGFAVLLPSLAVLGLALGFLEPVHAARFPWWKIAPRYLTIFVATALPEEILFRGLIQNWLMQRFGESWKTLLAAGLIFGASHLNNGPQALPNWRYMILATLAGVVFGRVFQRSTSIFASASLHALVNTVKYAFF